MSTAFPSTLPAPHKEYLLRAINTLSADRRFVGIAAAGSFADDTMDEFSDLDLVLVVEPAAFDEIMVQRAEIAESLSKLLVSFTGEHVGEPRLLICLYQVENATALHVDLKFVSLNDVGRRVDDPVVLWEREGRLSASFSGTRANYPSPDDQWVEDRFWIWVHYAAAKIGRGEYFEALEFLSFLRSTILSPLALKLVGERPSGVRRIESRSPSLATELEQTVAVNEAASLVRALRSCVSIYLKYRTSSNLELKPEAQTASLRYLDEVAEKITRTRQP